MYFTNFQKEIIIAINSEMVFDIESFFESFGNLEDKVCQQAHLHSFYSLGRLSTIKVPNDIEVLRTQTYDFVLVWNILTKSNLATEIKSGIEKILPRIFIFKDESSYDSTIVSIHRQFHGLRIRPHLNLQEFIANDYKTSQELEILEERKHRQRAQRLTIILALIPLIISTIINIVTFTTERDVKIINANDFRDTVKVQIIKTIDSTFSKLVSPDSME